MGYRSPLWRNGPLTDISSTIVQRGIEEDKTLMFCLCVEEIAKACASSALLLIIQAVGSFPIIVAANQRQRDRFFPRLSKGEELIGYLVTEPYAGSDVAGIKATAKKNNSEYILNGQKCFSTNGGVASLYTVLAKTNEEDLTFFVVERDQRGVSIGKTEDKLGFRGSNTAEVILEDVRVHEDNRLGQEGEDFFIAMKDLICPGQVLQPLPWVLQRQRSIARSIMHVRGRHSESP